MKGFRFKLWHKKPILVSAPHSRAKKSSQFKNRTLQIYVKAGQYSKELQGLNDKLSSYISTELKGKNVSFSVDQLKK